LDEQIDPVCTDEAYDTKHCRQVILDQDTHAVIPLKKALLHKPICKGFFSDIIFK